MQRSVPALPIETAALAPSAAVATPDASAKNLRRQVLLEPLRPATLYTIQVRALNRMGSGPESESVVITTPEAGPFASI